MKRIHRSVRFRSHYKHRISKDEQLRKDFIESVAAFREDKDLVGDHELEKPMKGERAFAINEEYRVVYVERKDSFLFKDVGTHAQVYRR